MKERGPVSGIGQLVEGVKRWEGVKGPFSSEEAMV